MTELKETHALLARMFARFAPVGALEGGGVTRLAYTSQEDEMHALFRAEAAALGFRVWEDAAGNSYAANFPEGTRDYTLIGSHLDSVIEGGAYDGVAGVLAGLAVLCELRGEGIPVAVAAFRCEESSNFGFCTAGSALALNDKSVEKLLMAKSRTGQPLIDALRAHGYTKPQSLLDGFARYLELHIEQGRVLQEEALDVGIVTAIAAPHRHRLTIEGLAEHSGATPKELRRDALCAAAEAILAVERIGLSEAHCASVATVGGIECRPNVMNAVPGRVTLLIDLRGVDALSLARMDQQLEARAQELAARRGVRCTLESIDEKSPCALSDAVQRGLLAAAEAEELRVRAMPSGAGHDAMLFAPLCPTGMVFIPCRDGISHNIAEHTELSQIENGVRVLLRYLRSDGEAAR